MTNNISKIALVTGAGSGIGQAVSLALLNNNYSVALLGRQQSKLEQTAKLAKSNSADLITICCDVAEPAQVAKAFDDIRSHYGRLDMLFNNAGISAPAVAMDELSIEDWKNVVDVNLSGAFYCAQQAIKLMKTQSPQGGRIINNGSISSQVPRPNSVPYTATKHAITGLTKCISLDGREHNIACGQIDIGNAGTPMTRRMTEGVPQANGQIAAEPVMDVEHVAEAVLQMANLPLESNVQFMTIMATKMPYVGRG